MKKFKQVVRQLAYDFKLPAGLEQIGFIDISEKPAIEVDLDNGQFAREPTDGLPKLVLELSRVEKGYTVGLSSIPPNDLYKYQTGDPIQRDEVVGLVTDYLKSVGSNKPFQ